MNKLVLLVGIVFSQLAGASSLFQPKTIADLKNTSVRIMNLEMTSGGTGSIYKSYPTGTHILTNKHVCRLIEPGGLVDYKGDQYSITHYKKFQNHDLCLVRIAVNLEINTKIATTLVKESSRVVVSGHPSLLPHITTFGHLSERQDIELVVGIKKCTKEDITEDPISCAFFGGVPVIQSFDAQLISNLIKPGNSGSAVFNLKGEVVGVVFAGRGRDLSYGYIVPQIYLLYFLQNADKFDWTEVGTPIDDGNFIERVFNYEKCKEVELKPDSKFQKIKDFCKDINNNLIWSK